MDVTIPGTAWIGRDKDIAVGSFLLGLLGLLLAYLCVTGLYLWWPRKWAKAFELRLNHGRFARDTDLHKQIGLICLIPLLMWGYTGAGFELTPVKKAWYAATLSEELPRVKVEAAPSSATPLTIDEAMGRAAAALPDLTVRSVRLPPPAKKGGEQGTYTVSLSTSIDPRAHFAVPGNVHVSVDPHTGEVVRIRNRPEESWAQQAWDWNFPLHAGTVVNSWWRIPWFLAGVGLIALGITGLSTWLYRLGTKRGRARAQRARSSR